MKRKYLPRLKVFLFAFAISASATVAAGVIYCPGGYYCNDIYDECMENGVLSPLTCEKMRDRCYLEACGSN